VKLETPRRLSFRKNSASEEVDRTPRPQTMRAVVGLVVAFAFAKRMEPLLPLPRRVVRGDYLSKRAAGSALPCRPMHMGRLPPPLQGLAMWALV
jgi:hypothetical protein